MEGGIGGGKFRAVVVGGGESSFGGGSGAFEEGACLSIKGLDGDFDLIFGLGGGDTEGSSRLES